MASFTLNNAVVLVGGYDLSSFTGSIDDLGGVVTMKEAPHFASKQHMVMLPGLKSYSTAISGWADYGSASAVSRAFTLRGVGSQNVVSVLPNVSGTSTAGDPCHFTRALNSSMKSPQGPVGDVAGFLMMLESDTAMVDGIVLHPLASRTSTGTGTITAMTGPTATQYLYAGLHVGAVTGTSPTLDVVIQSAALVGFGSPTTRVTFTQATGASSYTSQWATPVAGAITDGFWRVSYTIGGSSTPTFPFAVVLGVLTV
jgi:hypothetical protein